MSILVTNGRFGKVEEGLQFTSFDSSNPVVQIPHLNVASDVNPVDLLPHVKGVSMIRIDFPTSADGRGNSIAKALRDHGFTGHLRAKGHVLADQYPLALRCGFDDVEITSEHAARQPEWQWQDAYSRTQNSYQQRLMRRPLAARHAA